MTQSSTVRIGIAGALGRMGRAVAATIEARDDTTVAARYDRPGSEGAEGLVTLSDALAVSDAIIDFTTPASSVALAQAVAAGGPALIIGSTGISPQDAALIDAAAQKVVLVRTGNFSLGVNILLGLVRQAAAKLGPEDWDIEIFEAHHKRKIDAPSGTALMLGQAAADGRGIDLAANSDRGRDGLTGARTAGAIGFSVMRGGGIVGEHSVALVSEEEILTLSHSARDRALFAKGAVAAAIWAQGKAPGLYDMQDVLGFNAP